MSEMTSDLSTTELSESTQNLNHAKNTKRQKIEKKKKLYDEEIWSPASDDYLSNNSNTNKVCIMLCFPFVF